MTGNEREEIVEALWPIMANACANYKHTWSEHARVVLAAIREGKVPGIVEARSLPLIRNEMTAMQSELNTLRAELDSLKQSILDLSHPNCRMLVEERNAALDLLRDIRAWLTSPKMETWPYHENGLFDEDLSKGVNRIDATVPK